VNIVRTQSKRLVSFGYSIDVNQRNDEALLRTMSTPLNSWKIVVNCYLRNTFPVKIC